MKKNVMLFSFLLIAIIACSNISKASHVGYFALYESSDTAQFILANKDKGGWQTEKGRAFFNSIDNTNKKDAQGHNIRRINFSVANYMNKESYEMWTNRETSAVAIVCYSVNRKENDPPVFIFVEIVGMRPEFGGFYRGMLDFPPAEARPDISSYGYFFTTDARRYGNVQAPERIGKLTMLKMIQREELVLSGFFGPEQQKRFFDDGGMAYFVAFIPNNASGYQGKAVSFRETSMSIYLKINNNGTMLYLTAMKCGSLILDKGRRETFYKIENLTTNRELLIYLPGRKEGDQLFAMQVMSKNPKKISNLSGPIIAVEKRNRGPAEFPNDSTRVFSFFSYQPKEKTRSALLGANVISIPPESHTISFDKAAYHIDSALVWYSRINPDNDEMFSPGIMLSLYYIDQKTIKPNVIYGLNWGFSFYEPLILR